MERIKINILGDIHEYDVGITLKEIAKDFEGNYAFEVLGALVDNQIFDLNYEVNNDCEIRFITLMDREGTRIYRNGLIFLLRYVFNDLYKDKYKIKVCHSIDKAIKLKVNVPITSNEIIEVMNGMKDLVDEDIEITKSLVNKNEAVKYFKMTGDKDKEKMFSFIDEQFVTLYKLKNFYNYFYSVMPVSTKVFSKFNLRLLNSNDILLEIPNLYSDGEIPKYVQRDNIIDAFNDNYKLAKRLGIHNVSDLNECVSKGSISDIIKISELVSANDLFHLAKEITNKKDKIKLVLLAGPTSSGKTTATKKLAMYLKSFGFNPTHISIDNYFLNRLDTPKLESGEYDFESIASVDLELFNNHVNKLLNGEEIDLPTYNFLTGEKEYLGNKLKLEENDILLVEGLHAINDDLTRKIPDDIKYKVYISLLSDLNIDDDNMISTSDVRLLRRIVRDSRSRGYDVTQTISNWSKVRRGEEENIFPFQGDVDFVYNTSLLYEIGVLKLFVMPLLYNVSSDHSCYFEVLRLIKFLNLFLSVSTEEIPSDSLLREFIGNSYFE